MPRKAFIRRPAEHDTTLIRRGLQVAFLLLNLWIGVQFYAWVRYFESGGTSMFVRRPPGIEGWLPIAALMNLKFLLVTWTMPGIHAAGMFLLIAFGLISFVFRKAFCSWLCPIGTISEWIWQAGQAVLGRTFQLPTWLDIPLRGLKYILLALFVWVVVTMPAGEIQTFLMSPYGIVADVKMLDFFRRIGQTAATVIAAIVVLSALTKNFWCRYLCPYGALMGIVSALGPARIRRDPVACIDCDKCTAACPSFIPVAQLLTVKTPECTGCLDCVAVCPSASALSLSLPRRRVVQPWMVAVGTAVLFLAIVGYARFSDHWPDPIPDATYQELIPHVEAIGHPGL